MLIALLWRGHESHAVAQRWFARNSGDGWATCTITQAAFVRIVSNPAFSPGAVSPREALLLLESNLGHPHHRYWRDDAGFLDTVRDLAGQIQGHRQVTDAYLVGLALRHQGRLVTLDRGISALLPRGVKQTAVEVIGSAQN
jgi:toxin-antitoxin system PIN domain toxin